MKFLSLEKAREIVLGKLDSRFGIMEKYTKDFQWGTVFTIESKEYIETGKNGIVGVAPILVDKVDGSIHSICQKNETLDKELEEYRKARGYPHVIKFPPKGKLETMTDLEKVITLMSTGEFVQVEMAIKIVEEKKLFDLNGLGDLCYNYKINNLVESIARYFSGIGGEYILYESTLKRLPDEITLFKDKITSFYINSSKLEELPKSILRLKKLKSIYVTATPLRKMPHDLTPLENLKSVELERTKIKPENKNKFSLPNGCKLIIE